MKMIFITVFLIALAIFVGWDWLTIDSISLNTGTLQGVQYIAATPSIWGDVAIAVVILFVVSGAYCLVSLVILPILWRGGKDKNA